MVVRSGVVTAWPRPQLSVVQPAEDVSPVSPATIAEVVSQSLVEPIPPLDLAALIQVEGSGDSDGTADSPSSALQALADVALDEIDPSTDLNGLDLSLTGSIEAEGSAPTIPLVPLPSSPRLEPSETTVSAPTLDVDFYLPPPTHESPPPAVGVVRLDGVLPVVGDAIGNPTYRGAPSPVGVPALSQPIFFGDDFDMPTWFDRAPTEPLSPASTGPDAAGDPPRPSEVVSPLPSPETCTTTIRPVLTPRDLVMIARTTFGISRSDMLVSAIMIGFTTFLSHEEVAARLQLLWLMGQDYATHVRDVILLGQARQEPASLVLAELLEWAAPYIERHRPIHQ